MTTNRPPFTIENSKNPEADNVQAAADLLAGSNDRNIAAALRILEAAGFDNEDVVYEIEEAIGDLYMAAEGRHEFIGCALDRLDTAHDLLTVQA